MGDPINAETKLAELIRDFLGTIGLPEHVAIVAAPYDDELSYPTVEVVVTTGQIQHPKRGEFTPQVILHTMIKRPADDDGSDEQVFTPAAVENAWVAKIRLYLSEYGPPQTDPLQPKPLGFIEWLNALPDEQKEGWRLYNFNMTGTGMGQDREKGIRWRLSQYRCAFATSEMVMV